MFNLVTGIMEAISSGPENQKYESVSIAGVDPVGGEKLVLKERALQYWPESLSDSLEVGWNSVDTPGGSYPLRQWRSNGGRTLSFEITLSRQMKPVDGNSRTAREKLLGMAVDPTLKHPGVIGHNVDIVEYLRFLRAFTYPTYKIVDGYRMAYIPPLAILCFPNMGLNEDGSDAIFCFMSGCEVTYKLCFPDGTPRRVTVALSFLKSVQRPDGIYMPGLGDGAQVTYNTDPGEFDAAKAMGRSTNGLTVKGVQ